MPKNPIFCSLVPKTTTRGRANFKKYHQGESGWWADLYLRFSKKNKSLSHPKLELCPKTLFFGSLVQKTTTRGRASSKKYHQGESGWWSDMYLRFSQKPNVSIMSQNWVTKKLYFWHFHSVILKKILNKKIRVGHF